MPMVIERNDKQFPRMGDNNNLLERLAEYIQAFDKTWTKRIKPASKEQIEKLRNVSQLKKYANDFPKTYLIFLETMGIEDGGLLSKHLEGTANIENVMEMYHDFEIYEPQVFETPYLVFFVRVMGGEYSINLKEEHFDNIFATDCGWASIKRADSFEKLLFQAAFQQFEKFSYKIFFSASENNMEKAMEKHQIKDIFKQIEKAGEKYHLEKAWFSDTVNNIMLGTDVSFGVRKIEGGGANGFVTGDDPEKVEQITNKIIDIVRARIIESNLP